MLYTYVSSIRLYVRVVPLNLYPESGQVVLGGGCSVQGGRCSVQGGGVLGGGSLGSSPWRFGGYLFHFIGGMKADD